MNYLLATEYYPPHWTGIAKTFHYVAHSIKDQGHSVTVLTTQFDKTIPRSEKIDDIHIIRVPFQFRISRTHYSFLLVLTCLRMIKNFDGLVINSPNSNVLFLSIIAKIFRKKLIIYHQGDFTLPCKTGNQFLNRLLEKVFDVLTLPSFALCDIASTYTRDYAEHSRVMKHSLHKFHAYVPRYELSKQKPDEAFLKKMELLKKKHMLIGFAGRFVEEKAYENLLAAIPLILKKHPSAHFVFAGKLKLDYEPYYDILKKDIDAHKKDITFLGLLDGPELAEFYRSISLFVLSSRSDCFPTTQIEAALSHTPIVVTNIPGARMLVKETGFGEIAEAESAIDFAQSVITALGSLERYKKHIKDVDTFFETYKDFPLQ